jgi:hypothetical protein
MLAIALYLHDIIQHRKVWNHIDFSLHLQHCSIRALQHQSTEASEHYSIRALQHQSTTASEHCSIRALQHQSTAASEHYSIRALQHHDTMHCPNLPCSSCVTKVWRGAHAWWTTVAAFSPGIH